MKIERPLTYRLVWGSLLMLAALALTGWQVVAGAAATIYGWVTVGVLGALSSVLLFPIDAWKLIREIREAVPFFKDPTE